MKRQHLFAIVLLLLSSSCTPMGSGLDGTDADGRGQEVLTDDGADAAGAGRLPGGGLPGGGTYGMDGARGTGSDDDAGMPPAAGDLAGGGGAGGMDGTRETGDDPTMIPHPGRIPGQRYPGTDIGNPEEVDIPPKDWSFCFQQYKFILSSDIAMSIQSCDTDEARPEKYILTPPLRDGSVSVTFFFPFFTRMLMMLPPDRRLDHWVKTTLDLDLEFIRSPIPTMAGMDDGDRIVAATDDGSAIVLLRGDPELVDEMEITSKRLMRSTPIRCTDGEDVKRLKTPPPQCEIDMRIIRGLRDSTSPGKTFRLIDPARK